MLGERALDYAKRAGLNAYYLPVVQISLGKVEFNVYGSMSWTVATVRSMEWEELRPAYVAITGDDREDADQDSAKNVVAGELQKHWAEYHGRDDLIAVIEEQQDSRIEFALKDPPATPAGSRAAGGGRDDPGGSMAAKKKKGAAKKEKKAAASNGETRIPQKGASGLAAKLIGEGLHDRAKVTEKVTKAFPDVKNPAPAISYAARCVGVSLS